MQEYVHEKIGFFDCFLSTGGLVGIKCLSYFITIELSILGVQLKEFQEQFKKDVAENLPD
jgi:hypothetical protein